MFLGLLLLFFCLQFSYGGPIIAFQIENEYASYSDRLSSEYMVHLRNVRYSVVMVTVM